MDYKEEIKDICLRSALSPFEKVKLQIKFQKLLEKKDVELAKYSEEEQKEIMKFIKILCERYHFQQGDSILEDAIIDISNRKKIVMSKMLSKYVNDCYKFWSKNAQLFKDVVNDPSSDYNTGYEVSVFNDPINGNSFEGNGTSNEEYNGENGDGSKSPIVIMGFNPAGTITKTMHKNINCHQLFPKLSILPLPNRNINDLNIYNPYVNGTPIDSYTKAMDEFANQCGYKNNYAKIDAFGLLQSNQNKLENDIVNNPAKYVDILKLSISAVIDVAPKAVVFANAGLRRIIINNKLFGNMVVLKNWNNQKCAWEIELNDGQRTHKCWGVFTTMLSGGHLDNGSKEIIAQVVKNL